MKGCCETPFFVTEIDFGMKNFYIGLQVFMANFLKNMKINFVRMKNVRTFALSFEGETIHSSINSEGNNC